MRIFYNLKNKRVFVSSTAPATLVASDKFNIGREWFSVVATVYHFLEDLQRIRSLHLNGIVDSSVEIVYITPTSSPELFPTMQKRPRSAVFSSVDRLIAKR